MLNEAIGFGLFQMVLRFYHNFAQRATHSNGGTDALGVEGSAEFSGKAGEVGKVDVTVACFGCGCGR